MKRLIDENPSEVFLIEGHTDAVGSNESNLELSDRRAETIADLLVDIYNIPPENLTTQGYGEEYLKVETEEAERANRRVQVRRITPLVASADAA
jgi:outer membrane protein OmpA-like peptidoglycan-associated protein